LETHELLFEKAYATGGKELRKMLVLVPARAEPATALEWGQLGEAPGQARVWDWAEHPARQPWVKVLVTSPFPRYSFAMVRVPSSNLTQRWASSMM
jgi:hypothetical protein